MEHSSCSFLELAASIRIAATEFGDLPASWDLEGSDILTSLEDIAIRIANLSPAE